MLSLTFFLASCSPYNSNGELGFYESPENFEKYLNSNTDWGRGREVTFSSLDDCKKDDSGYYGCFYGFIEYSAPNSYYNCELHPWVGVKATRKNDGIVYIDTGCSGGDFLYGKSKS